MIIIIIYVFIYKFLFLVMKQCAALNHIDLKNKKAPERAFKIQ